MTKKILTVALAVSFFLFFSISTAVATDLEETKIPDELTPGLDYLLTLVSPGNTDTFDLQLVEKVLDFVLAPKNDSVLFYAEKKDGANSAYYEFNIQKDLNHILEYTYNSKIPATVVMPSAVRLSYWSEVNGTQQPLPRLWTLPPESASPVIVRGVEHIEITPDQSSGAYYSYDMNKLLILCKYQGRNLLIQIDKQKDMSDVGKKGLILGQDEDWNYFYSGEKGISKTGLGWVDSYMYDSFGVSVFYEADDKTPVVRCGSFKWLRAGWSNMNFVNNHHIYNGMVRYAKGFKAILENPSLPAQPELAGMCSQLEALSLDDLREKVKPYLKTLENRLSDENSSDEAFTELLKNGEYLAQLTRREMEAMLVLEYLKSALGKDQRFGG